MKFNFYSHNSDQIINTPHLIPTLGKVDMCMGI